MKATSSLEADRRQWQRIEEIFHRAEALPPARRKAFLSSACGRDEQLRARVEALLSAEVDQIDVLGQILTPSGTGGPDDPGDDPRPERIGSYRILRELGRGGLSCVYLAERADGTFHKHVALKLVRRGLDTRDILDRLRQERQILARLDHPNIARLLDGGSTADGRPYFVMEHVEGVPIDRFCQERRLSLGERIELFRTVCSAVHYAHQNLTIHRDIKPSNILVTGDGIPKLLDFGIAKVLESDGTQTTWQMTRPGLRFMTPAYASPEQIHGEVLSTSTDIYSLGILLFRLLTGTGPFDLEGLGFNRLEKLICETPPPRPSQRLTPEAMASVGLMGVSQKRLAARLAGDLDTITCVALRKEPERRYGSAEQLGDDLRRHRAGLPVLARPDRWRYRTEKFLRRHWRGLAAMAVMTLTLAGVVTFYSWQLVEERNRALEASARAELESSKSARVTDFLQQIFAVSNPSRSLGESVTAQQLLDRGAAQIEEELAQEPEVQASLMEAISESYAGLGLFEEAEAQLERSFALRRRHFEAPHEALATSHEKLGELRVSQGRYEEAEEHFSEALRQRRLVLGADHPRTAESEGSLGAVAHTLGRFTEAEARYRQALARLQVRPGPRGQATLLVQSNLVTLLYNQKRLEEAETLGRQVLALQQEEIGRDHPDTINTEGTLVAILVAGGRYSDAEPLLRTLWRRQRELLGDDHPDVALAANNLAAALFYLERYDEAEPLYRRALAIQEELHGPRHVKTVATMLNLADLEATGRGNDEAARLLYQQALSLRRSLVSRGSLDLLNPLLSLGELELRQKRPEAAARWLEEAVAVLEADAAQPSPRREAWRLAQARSLLGKAMVEGGDTTRGRDLLEGALEVLRRELGEDHPKTRAALRRSRELPP